MGVSNFILQNVLLLKPSVENVRFSNYNTKENFCNMDYLILIIMLDYEWHSGFEIYNCPKTDVYLSFHIWIHIWIPNIFY